MSGNNQKPTRWYYLLALLLPVIACGITASLIYRSVPTLPGALETMDINNLTRVVVPGSAEVNFPKVGAYAVYYEYRSVINGVNYVRDKYPPFISCQLRSKATGENIELASPQAEGDIYSTQNRERAGVLFKSISINQPGVHTFSCRYLDGRSNPQIVLAVGPNMIWEFFNIAAKPVSAFFCGGLVFLIALGLSILFIAIVAFKRHQSKQVLAGE
ncbi:MAG: hypothetical protein JSV69_11550 [Chloroflexota bacterium]|nr:MAG: hypothetical protein JSV69_11550 [Chloroflexota bacterium]